MKFVDDTKDVPLEALRGLAAIVVLFSHITVGFFPQLYGIFLDKWPKELAVDGEIWFFAINGGSAVTLFFVLSSFVLTRRFFRTGDTTIILRGALKRWPRLCGPVLLTVIFSWAMFKLNWYRFSDGAALTVSPWLLKFGYAFGEPFIPSLPDAVGQGAFFTFFRGDAYYDSSLWTMRYEFIGSFVAFSLALLLSLSPPGVALPRAVLIVVTLILCHFANPHYAAFPAGVALAAFLPIRKEGLPWMAFIPMIALSLYLFGYSDSGRGAFAPIAWALGAVLPTPEIHLLAGVIIVAAFELSPDPFRATLSGTIARFLGRLSFPLYLVHVPILCSAGCMALLWTNGWVPGPYPRIIAGIFTLIASVAAALPLMAFNERWVRLVNDGVGLIFSKRPDQSGAQFKERRQQLG